MPVDVNVLKTISIFEDICEANLHKLSSIICPLRVCEEEMLTRRGIPATNLYIVTSGNFMAFFKGGQSVTLHNKGDVIGWSSIITPFRYKGSSVALTDGEVLCIPSRKLLRLVRENSELATKLIQKINTVIQNRLPFVNGQPVVENETVRHAA